MEKLTTKFKDFFIPSERNNYRAKTLHINFLTVYLALALVLVTLEQTATFTSGVGVILGIATDIKISKLFDLTNKERIKRGLSLLTYNDKLAEAAKKKAQDMFKSDYWAHFSPDGKTPWDFINGAGYKYEYAGENLAKNFMFSDTVVSAWMNSKSHRDNVLRDQYREVGFAVVNGVLEGEETTLVVEMFGAPIKSVAESQANSPPLILASENSGKPIINLKKLSLNYGLVIFSLLIFSLILDLYFAARLGVVRITGKHLAHLIFLTVVIISLFIATKGAII